jgi:hypothetical protein
MLTWLVERSPLARIQDRDAELSQLGVVRVVVGAVCIARLVPNLWASLYLFPPEAAGALPALTTEGLWVLGLTVAVTAGVLTPLALAALLILLRRYELVTDASSLVTGVACLVLTFLFVAGAGSTRSVDAWLMRRQGVLSAIVRLPYRLVGIPSLVGLKNVYLLFFLAYAFMHLGGALYHWQTEAWTSGDALAMVFSSSYLARFWEPYRALESMLPGAVHLFAAGATVVQLLMQTMTAPMMFWRRTAPVAVLWGFLFTISSIVLLQLNYLGVFELLLWFTLFHRPRPSVAPQPAVALRPALVERTLHAFVAAVLMLFVANDVVYVANDVVYASGHEAWRNERISRAFAAVGLQAPDVFNDNDLRLGDAWPVVYYGNRDQLLPIHGLNGERLTWIWWSDLLFYGIANRWKNDISSHDIFDPAKPPIQRLMRLTLFDHRRRRASEGRYVVDYFRTRASYVEEPPHERFGRKYLGSQTILCSGVASEASCVAVAARDDPPR